MEECTLVTFLSMSKQRKRLLLKEIDLSGLMLTMVSQVLLESIQVGYKKCAQCGGGHVRAACVDLVLSHRRVPHAYFDGSHGARPLPRSRLLSSSCGNTLSGRRLCNVLRCLEQCSVSAYERSVRRCCCCFESDAVKELSCCYFWLHKLARGVHRVL